MQNVMLLDQGINEAIGRIIRDTALWPSIAESLHDPGALSRFLHERGLTLAEKAVAYVVDHADAMEQLHTLIHNKSFVIPIT